MNFLFYLTKDDQVLKVSEKDRDPNLVCAIRVLVFC